MKGVIFFLVYLLLASSIANAKPAKKELEAVFLQTEEAKTDYIGNTSDRYIYPVNQGSASAINTCQVLLKSRPVNRCKLYLINPNQENNCFYQMQDRVQAYCDSQAGKCYLDSCNDCYIDKEKTQDAYKLIKEEGLENSFEGLAIKADLAMLEKDFNVAEDLYTKALSIEQENESVKTKLATCFRKQKKYKKAEELYTEIFEKNQNSSPYDINLAYLAMEQKNYKKAICAFEKILNKNKDCKEAKMGLVSVYIADGENLSALALLNGMPESEEVSNAKANIYYTLGMYSSARESIKGDAEDNADLPTQIKKARAFTITPSYTLFNQELSDSYDLDLRKVGIGLSEYGAMNTKVFLDYGLYVYISGNYNNIHLVNVTNEVRGGVQSRPTEKTEFRTDIGVKSFEYGGAMLNTDSWVKHYVSDSFNYKVGFKRNNCEQSYLAAVGFPINGIFTGRIAENKVYADFEGRLAKKYYYFGRIGGGAYTAQNLSTNAFAEGLIGLGKIIYNKPENKWFQTMATDLVSYNSSYQMNLLDIPGATGSQSTFGGYFSPSYYNADTVSLKLDGEVKKWHLKYGLKGFVGAQFIFSPDWVSPVYGISPYFSYDLNDHLSVNCSYIFSDYSGIQRHLAFVNINIKCFKSNKLSKNRNSNELNVG